MGLHTEIWAENRVGIDEATGNATGRRSFWVEAPSQDAAFSDSRTPQRGHLFVNEQGNTFAPFMVVSSRDCSTHKPGAGADALYKIDVSYATPSGGSSTEEPEAGGPAIDSWSIGATTGPIDTGFNGNERNVPIANSAGQVYDPPSSGYIPTFTLTSRRVVAGQFAPSFSVQNVVKTNSDDFRGAKPGEALFLGISNSGLRPDGTEELSLTVEFRASQDGGFKLKLLDRDREGFLLDGNGKRLAKGDPAKFIEFVIYQSFPFGGLGFGS